MPQPKTKDSKYRRMFGMTMKEAAEKLGTDRSTIRSRLRAGWNVREAFTKKPNYGTLLTAKFNGETKTISQWAREIGGSYNSLVSRFKRTGKISSECPHCKKEFILSHSEAEILSFEE